MTEKPLITAGTALAEGKDVEVGLIYKALRCLPTIDQAKAIDYVKSLSPEKKDAVYTMILFAGDLVAEQSAVGVSLANSEWPIRMRKMHRYHGDEGCGCPFTEGYKDQIEQVHLWDCAYGF